MHSFIALLRAVNVGGTGKRPMADLRGMAEACGFENVRSYIQSGNLLFDTDQSAGAAQQALEDRLLAYAGKPVGTLMRTPEDLAEVLTRNPFADAAPNQVGIVFLSSAPPHDTEHAAKGRQDEEIVLGAREVYLHFPRGMGQSKLKLSAMDHGTLRNLNTVRKLQDMGTKGLA